MTSKVYNSHFHTLMQESGDLTETCVAGRTMRKTNKSAAVTQQRKIKNTVDFYPTPASTTRMFLSWLEQRHEDLSEKTCWEPAAGALDMSKELELTFRDVYSSDFHDPAELGLDRIDFASQLFIPGAGYTRDWIITNPPFSLATDFILNALRYSTNGVAMLVRVGFLEGVQRYQSLFHDMPPTDFCVYVRRQTFTEGKIDEDRGSAMCFAWVVWDKGEDDYGKTTKVSWLI